MPKRTRDDFDSEVESEYNIRTVDQNRITSEHKILHKINTWFTDTTPEFENAHSFEICYDYIKLPKFKILCQKLRTGLPNLSIKYLENFFIRMTKSTILRKPFKKIKPFKWPEMDEKKAAKYWRSCVITNEGVYIHTSEILKHRWGSHAHLLMLVGSVSDLHEEVERTAKKLKETLEELKLFKT